MGMIKLLAELLRLRRNTTLGRQELSEVQEQKMRHILRYAWDHSAFYRRTFAEAGITEKTIDTAPIQSFPTIDKETLMEHFEELVTVEDLKQEEIARFDVEKELSEKRYLGKYHLVHSSGSTGVPRYFVYDEAAWHQMLLGIIRGALWGMSMPEILRLLTPKPRIMYIAATDGRYGGAMAVGDGIDGLGAHQMQLNVNTPLEDWKKAAEEFNPNIIIGYPSAVKILGGLQKEGAIHLKLSRLITCGEPLSAGLRKFLESVFSVKVVNFYGSSESLAMGVETDAEEGMYLFDDLNYIEYTNGQMYLTCLYNEVQPLIRYRLTDKLRFREDSRQHGMKGNRAFSRVETVTGRDEDILWFQDRDGRREFLHPLSVEGICEEGLIDYQFRQTGLESFQMLAETEPDADREAIAQGVHNMMGMILAEKHLKFVDFSICFTEKIKPDPVTGKKSLILVMSRNEACHGS